MSATCVIQPGTKSRKVVPTPACRRMDLSVNLREPQQSKDMSIRKFVRSNAMRDYRQKKKRNELKHQRELGNTTAGHQFRDSLHLVKSPLPSATRDDDNGGCFMSCGQAKRVCDRK